MQSSQDQDTGFFAGLLDFSFTSFITLKFLKVIYAVLVVFVLLSGLVMFVSLVSRGGGAVLVALVLVPLITLLYLVFARVGMEVLAVLFRIGEDVRTIARAVPGGAGGVGAGPSGYGPSDAPQPADPHV